MGSFQKSLAAVVLLMLARAAPAADGKNVAVPQYVVKAGLLFQFTQLGVWPVLAFPGQDSRFVVGILGDDPFGIVADETLAGKTAQGRLVVVQRFRKLEDFLKRQVLFVHVLFVSASEKDQIQQILGTVRGMPVLTVGELPGFTEMGGTVNFLIVDRKVRFEINEERDRPDRIALGAELLRAAKNSQAFAGQN